MGKLVNRIPYPLLLLVCLTMGLAPFTPEPHLLEKIRLLAAGALTRPIDMFDFLLHGTPWVLLGLKLFWHRAGKPEQ